MLSERDFNTAIAYNDFITITQYLKENTYTNPNIRHQLKTILFRSARYEYLECLECILKHYKDNIPKDFYALSLKTAVMSNKPKCVELFLIYGIDPNIPAWGMWTALMYAVYTNNLEIILILLSYGADINVQTSWHNTATTITNNQDIIRVLNEYAIARQEWIPETHWCYPKKSKEEIEVLMWMWTKHEDVIPIPLELIYEVNKFLAEK